MLRSEITHHTSSTQPGHRHAVPAHQDRGLVAELLGERAPQLGIAHQHVGHAANFTSAKLPTAIARSSKKTAIEQIPTSSAPGQQAAQNIRMLPTFPAAR
jgi:hypothetical protein